MAQLDENCDETPRGHEGMSTWIKAGTGRTAQVPGIGSGWQDVPSCTHFIGTETGRKGLAP